MNSGEVLFFVTPRMRKKFFYQQFKLRFASFALMQKQRVRERERTNCETSHKFQINFYLSITAALNKETIVSIDEEDKTQYHKVNFNTSK